jgi:hypothetical protein
MAECEACASELTTAAFECRECGTVTCRSHRAPEEHDCRAGPHAVPDYRILDPNTVSTGEDRGGASASEPATGTERVVLEVIDGIFEALAILLRAVVFLGRLLVLLAVGVVVIAMLAISVAGAASSVSVDPSVLVIGLVAGVGLLVAGYVLLSLAANRSWRQGVSVGQVRERAAGALYSRWYSVKTSLTGGRPGDGGTVTFSGTVVPLTDPLSSPIEAEDAVLWAYHVDAFDDRTDAQFGTASEPTWPDLAAGVVAEPFAVETDGRELVVDPRPFDPETERGPAAEDHPSNWPGTTLEYSERVDRMLTVDDLEGEFRRLVEEAFERRAGRPLRGNVYLRVTVDRIEPGADVRVLGWSVGDRDHPEPDVVNVADVGTPFRLSTG